jgi:hypothetical protein
MCGRLALTIAVWLAGSLFFFVMDGQVFTHSLQLLGCAVLAALTWVPLLSRRQDRGRRIAGAAVVALSAVVIVGVSLQLPAAREQQRSFNARSAGPSAPLRPDL